MRAGDPRHRIGHRFCIAAAFLLLGLDTAAIAGIELRAEPAWGGRFVPGRTSELRVDLASERGGTFSLELSSGETRIRRQGVLEAGRHISTALPFHPSADGQIHLRATGPDGTKVERAFTLRPVSALLQPATPGALAADSATDRLIVAPMDLPQTPAGYGIVDRVALDRAAIAALDAPRHQALAAFLGSCGGLDLAADAEELLPAARLLAGCGQRGLARSGDGSEGNPAHLAAPRLAALLAADPESPTSAWWPELIVAYLLVLTLLPARLAQPAHLLGLATLASLAVLLTAHWRTPSVDGVALVQAESGSNQGRLSALLRLNGDGLDKATIAIDGRLAPPLAIDPGPALIDYTATPVARFELQATAPFMGHRTFYLQGSLPLASRPRIEIDAGRMTLVNAGTTALPAGLLLYGGGLTPSPPLGPAARWDVTADTSTGPTGVEPLMRELALHAQALWVLPLAGAEAENLARLGGADGWLMVRLPGEPGA